MANVKLTWNDNSDNETGFYVYRRNEHRSTSEFQDGKDGDGAVSSADRVGTVGAGVAQFVDTEVGVGDYTYRVAAYNDAGETFCTSPSVVAVTVTG